MREIDDLEGTAEYLGISPASLRQRRYRGDGPPAIKLSPGRRGLLRFRKADVDAWLDAHREVQAS